jgi:hypothetical protein
MLATIKKRGLGLKVTETGWLWSLPIFEMLGWGKGVQFSNCSGMNEARMICVFFPFFSSSSREILTRGQR